LQVRVLLGSPTAFSSAEVIRTPVLVGHIGRLSGRNHTSGQIRRGSDALRRRAGDQDLDEVGPWTSDVVAASIASFVKTSRVPGSS